MTKEIKFRYLLKNKETGRTWFVFRELRQLEKGDTFASFITIESVDEYTGIKDRKGNEIYVSDIVNCDSMRICGPIEWSEDQGRLIIRQIENSKCGYMSTKSRVCSGHIPLIKASDYQVIGNIHKNADLLELSTV